MDYDTSVVVPTAQSTHLTQNQRSLFNFPKIDEYETTPNANLGDVTHHSVDLDNGLTSVVPVHKSSQPLEQSSGSGGLGTVTTFNVNAVNRDLIKKVAYLVDLGETRVESSLTTMSAADLTTLVKNTAKQMYAKNLDGTSRTYPTGVSESDVNEAIDTSIGIDAETVRYYIPGKTTLQRTTQAATSFANKECVNKFKFVDNWGNRIIEEYTESIGSFTVSTIDHNAIMRLHNENTSQIKKEMIDKIAGTEGNDTMCMDMIYGIPHVDSANELRTVTRKMNQKNNEFLKVHKPKSAQVVLPFFVSYNEKGAIKVAETHNSDYLIKIKKAMLEDITVMIPSACAIITPNAVLNTYLKLRGKKLLVPLPDTTSRVVCPTGVTKNIIVPVAESIPDMKNVIANTFSSTLIRSYVQSLTAITSSTLHKTVTNCRGPIERIRVFIEDKAALNKNNPCRGFDWVNGGPIVRYYGPSDKLSHEMNITKTYTDDQATTETSGDALNYYRESTLMSQPTVSGDIIDQNMKLKISINSTPVADFDNSNSAKLLMNDGTGFTVSSDSTGVNFTRSNDQLAHIPNSTIFAESSTLTINVIFSDEISERITALANAGKEKMVLHVLVTTINIAYFDDPKGKGGRPQVGFK